MKDLFFMSSEEELFLLNFCQALTVHIDICVELDPNLPIEEIHIAQKNETSF
jgi:hypothetical protein